MTALFRQIERPVKQFLANIIADQGLREQITYKRYKSAVHDRNVGHKVITYDEFTLYSVRLQHTKESAKGSTGNVETGDEVFIIHGDDAPSDMTLKDQIVDASSNTLALKHIDNIFNLAVMITVEGGKRIPA